MDRHVVAHGDDCTPAVEYSARIIASLFDIGRKRGTPKRRPHLLCDGVKEVLENFEFDGIAPHQAQCTGREIFNSLQNYVDTAFIVPQYLVSRTLLIRQVG